MFNFVFYSIDYLLFSDIPLLYYCINFGSLVIFCLCSGDIYLSLGSIFLSAV